MRELRGFGRNGPAVNWESEVLSQFDPLVSEWFASRFDGLTEPQVQGWPLIREGCDVLISAPTGSGKTLAAFLTASTPWCGGRGSALSPTRPRSCTSRRSRRSATTSTRTSKSRWPKSPPWQPSAGIPLAPIRTALRTGDTPQWERQQMTRHRPHILVTTPESLFILLTAAKPREMLSQRPHR